MPKNCPPDCEWAAKSFLHVHVVSMHLHPTLVEITSNLRQTRGLSRRTLPRVHAFKSMLRAGRGYRWGM